MSKYIFVLCIVVALVKADSFGWRTDLPIILPTYIYPQTPRTVIYRTVRDVSEKPVRHYESENIRNGASSGDYTTLPTIIDDVKLGSSRRYVRSFDSRSSKHHGGSHSTSSGSRDTGATHPGYNRRNA